MSLLIALDNTDTPGTPGTGRFARAIVAVITGQYPVAGATRHQLLVDPAIPYASHTSSAVIRACAVADSPYASPASPATSCLPVSLRAPTPGSRPSTRLPSHRPWLRSARTPSGAY